jgi:RNA polymerase sigma-70 factor (ECF subfamily)
LDGAATRAIEGYGPEIYGFLVTRHAGEDEAADVFSAVTESLWRALPKFAWESSLRTWAYTIARHASVRARTNEQRRARGAVPIDEQASRLAMEVRTRTQTFLRTERRSAIAQLRDELPTEDRTLLVLRVDRELAWNELARIMLDAPDPDEVTVKREAARLRKRFQLVKERLVAMGRERGLLP